MTVGSPVDANADGHCRAVLMGGPCDGATMKVPLSWLTMIVTPPSGGVDHRLSSPHPPAQYERAHEIHAWGAAQPVSVVFLYVQPETATA